ncbi:hypothetical protein C1H46_021859 [Malus baccata]|uniref:Uncharacterized protein n=1 Tax=Malus baccata TaxID=106549 RepID=A0A540M1B4_MALBA|nr:hypothetical protein C1H46_021859 [Malus baccata]
MGTPLCLFVKAGLPSERSKKDGYEFFFRIMTTNSGPLLAEYSTSLSIRLYSSLIPQTEAESSIEIEFPADFRCWRKEEKFQGEERPWRRTTQAPEEVHIFVELDKNDNNFADCDKLAKAFLQELNTFEIPLFKSKDVVDANLREKHNFDKLREKINWQIVQAKADIKTLKEQLKESKIEIRHNEECEAIRKLIATQPLRFETLKIISDLEKKIAALDEENTASLQTLELRNKQFALFLHVVCELY